MNRHPPSSPRPTLDYATPRRTRKYRIVPGVAAAALIVFALTAYFFIVIRPTSTPWANQPSSRTQCASNMRQIGLGILLYAAAHDDQFPDRLEQLLLTTEIQPKAFCCPFSNDTPPPGDTPEARAANLAAGGHLSYIYVGTGLTIVAGARTVALYEPFDHHTDGMNVLFADGHVEFVHRDKGERLIQELSAGHNPPRPEKLE